jgi:hypothetical protein
MATGLIDIIKRTALEAFANEQPCDLRYGTVVSVDPLRVKVTNLLTIPSSVLVVPQLLTDYTVIIRDEESSEDKTITIKNALKIGDKVAMLRKQGGQSYFILDRI